MCVTDNSVSGTQRRWKSNFQRWRMRQCCHDVLIAVFCSSFKTVMFPGAGQFLINSYKVDTVIEKLAMRRWKNVAAWIKDRSSVTVRNGRRSVYVLTMDGSV